jgi:exonuclease III
MKIVTWNINTAEHPLTDDKIAYVKNLDRDIIALQETKNEKTENENPFWDWKCNTSVGDIWCDSKKKKDLMNLFAV